MWMSSALHPFLILNSSDTPINHSKVTKGSKQFTEGGDKKHILKVTGEKEYIKSLISLHLS